MGMLIFAVVLHAAFGQICTSLMGGGGPSTFTQKREQIFTHAQGCTLAQLSCLPFTPRTDRHLTKEAKNVHLTVFTFRAPMYKSAVCSLHNAYVRQPAKTSTALFARSRMIWLLPLPPHLPSASYVSFPVFICIADQAY